MDERFDIGSGSTTPANEDPAERPALRVVKGGGKPRSTKLESRDDLARVLVGAAADMLLKRISSTRAHAIEQKVEKVMALFDRVEREPLMERVLRRELDDLEALVREGATRRPVRAAR